MIATLAISLVVLGLCWAVGRYQSPFTPVIDQCLVGFASLLIIGLAGGAILGLSYELAKWMGWTT